MYIVEFGTCWKSKTSYVSLMRLAKSPSSRITICSRLMTSSRYSLTVLNLASKLSITWYKLSMRCSILLRWRSVFSKPCCILSKRLLRPSILVPSVCERMPNWAIVLVNCFKVIDSSLSVRKVASVSLELCVLLGDDEGNSTWLPTL